MVDTYTLPTYRDTVRDHLLPLHHITDLPGNLLTFLMVTVSLGLPRSEFILYVTLVPGLEMTVLDLNRTQSSVGELLAVFIGTGLTHRLTDLRKKRSRMKGGGKKEKAIYSPFLEFRNTSLQVPWYRPSPSRNLQFHA